MDREIPKKERTKIRRKRLGAYLLAAILIGLVVLGLALFFDDGIEEKNLNFAIAETGRIESGVSATGKIVPLYEEAIVSPVATKILEVYCNEGDSVIAGKALLRLDLQSAETELRRLADEVNMKKIAEQQTALNNDTYLTDLEMKIKAKEMSVVHLQAEVEKERRLDSLGSGTGERIREAELAYSTGRLELEQMKMQLQNEKKTHVAAYKSSQLETSISDRNLHEMQRTIDDAHVKAIRPGTITFINKNIGSSIAPGEKLAIISDLGHFKITGEIPEGNSSKLSVGSEVKIKLNHNILTGHISSISPQSENGMVQFNVILEKDNDKALRAGLSADLNVVYDIVDGVVRIPAGSYYQGPGQYVMFVRVSPETIEQRNVTLGGANFDYVEVKSGIKQGEEVVVNDMSDYKNRKSIKLR